QAPAAAPRKNRVFLRIVGEPSRCQLLPKSGRVTLPLFGLGRQTHNTFLVSLRPVCHVAGWVPRPTAEPWLNITERSLDAQLQRGVDRELRCQWMGRFSLLAISLDAHQLPAARGARG